MSGSPDGRRPPGDGPERQEIVYGASSRIQFAPPRRASGPARGPPAQTRRDGHVPAVIYGNKQKPALISLDPQELERDAAQAGLLHHACSTSRSAARRYRVLPRDVQFDPVTDVPIHVDFLRVSKDARVNVDVPVEFVNEREASPGLKRGGVLNVVRHEIEVDCAADDIPQHDHGRPRRPRHRRFHPHQHVKLPKACARPSRRDFTVATSPRRRLKAEEAAAAAPRLQRRLRPLLQRLPARLGAPAGSGRWRCGGCRRQGCGRRQRPGGGDEEPAKK